MGLDTRVLAAIRKQGLLLKQDRTLPSVVGLITGETLASSWWNHPRAKAIYDTLEALAERDDVVETKLIAGKVTFVFTTLWPALLGVGTSDEPWQRTDLTAAAKKLLGEVEERGAIEASGAAVKELETRVLVRSEQRHTASGKHVLVLEMWSRWAKRCELVAASPHESKELLERAAGSLGARPNALPWQRRSSR